MKKAILFLLIFIWLFLPTGLFPLAFADPTIQNLIDAAPEGGTVAVPAGTFNENLSVEEFVIKRIEFRINST